jgi:hypothetical protein
MTLQCICLLPIIESEISVVLFIKAPVIWMANGSDGVQLASGSHFVCCEVPKLTKEPSTLPLSNPVLAL